MSHLRQGYGGLFALLALFFAASVVHAGESYESHPGLLYPGGLVIFLNSEAPMSYTSYARNELPKDAVLAGDIYAQGCQYGISLPLSLIGGGNAGSISGAAGNGGYKKALQKIHAEHPALRGLYDVKVDLHATIILGVFSRLCTEINARSYQ